MRLLKRPKKSLGQNFLVDQNIIKKIIKIENISEKSIVLEIGAGYGSLTKKIKEAKPKKIFAIEKDVNLAQSLEKDLKKFDVIFGMYHDQVLTPFKALFKYNAINITLGLPFIRVSPDHGIAEDIVGKKIANPNSLIDSIKFFNNIN